MSNEIKRRFAHVSTREIEGFSEMVAGADVRVQIARDRAFAEAAALAETRGVISLAADIRARIGTPVR